jgi:cbb3-type cytochrome oxidase cytochrome c subunit
MKGLVPLFIGLFGTFAFSWVGLTVIPNWQIGALNPQTDEEGADAYPTPKSGMAERGRRIYAANGCIYCHSQQIRSDYASADIDRVRDAGPSPGPKWAERRSAPRDYIFDRPVVLGQERMGPDVANIGKAAPTEEEKPAAAPPANAPANSPVPAQSPPGNASAPKPGTSGSPAAPATSPAPPAAAANPTGLPPAYSEAWHHRHLYSPRSMSPDNRDSTMPAYKFL